MNITFDNQQAFDSICHFLSENLTDSGLDGFVVGLSGGIDSALSAALAVEAVGPGRVFGILMPYRTSDSASVEDAKMLAKHLQIDHKIIDISPMIDAYYSKIEPDDRLRAGNKMARERMSILFDHAHKHSQLVLGTGNRTEIALGYTTIYGDSACSLNPIGELYKSEVRLLAAHLGLPETILTKAPSADLWAGQTDEDEIGVTYETIDRLLKRILDDSERSRKVLASEGFAVNDINRMLKMLNRNSFKRFPPPVASLGRTPIPIQIELGE